MNQLGRLTRMQILNLNFHVVTESPPRAPPSSDTPTFEAVYCHQVVEACTEQTLGRWWVHSQAAGLVVCIIQEANFILQNWRRFSDEWRNTHRKLQVQLPTNYPSGEWTLVSRLWWAVEHWWVWLIRKQSWQLQVCLDATTALLISAHPPYSYIYVCLFFVLNCRNVIDQHPVPPYVTHTVQALWTRRGLVRSSVHSVSLM